MKTALKWLGRILLGILLIGLLALGGPVGWEVATGPTADDFTNTTYPAQDGSTLRGYLTQPEGDGPFPAVLLIHEWWGLTEDITAIADELAAEGYVVLAPDAYRGPTTNLVPRAIYLATSIPGERIDSDLDDAYAYLRSLDTVAADRTAAWGFCFGGREALGLATRNAEMAALVDFYGGSPITDPAELGELTGPVLGVFGAEDQQIPLEEVRQFEDALEARAIPHTITIYDGVGHAFLTSENLNDTDSAPGQAWQQTLAFLAEHLQTDG